jgi:hypothetical protein
VPQPKKQRRIGQTDLLGSYDFFADMEDVTPARSKKVTEITRFHDLPIVVNKPGFSVLAWWKDHQESYPKLSCLARSILGCRVARVTSANVETRGLVGPLRTSMTTEHIEDWMMNKVNRSLQ